MFVAQRAERGLGVAVRQMCLVRTRLGEGRLVLDAPGVEPLDVPVEGVDGPQVDVRIWESTASGVDQGREAAAWLTDILGRYRPGAYRLVRMPDAGSRRTAQEDARLGYADGYPLLVATQASLDDLNARIRRRRSEAGEPAVAPLGWDRFRPNVVVGGAPPYAEDGWATMQAGEVSLA